MARRVALLYLRQQKHQAQVPLSSCTAASIQSLTVPVSMAYHWPLSRRVQLFTSATATLHPPLHSTLESYYLLPNGTEAEPTRQSLHPGLQWSVGIGVGAQYNLTPHVNFFVQPSLQHYFTSSGRVSTWNTDHTVVVSLPFGVMISF